MSIQTTMARAEWRAADLTWRVHVKQECPPCRDAKKARKWSLTCGRGQDLLEVRAKLKRELDAQVELDRRVPPSQPALFSRADCGG